MTSKPKTPGAKGAAGLGAFPTIPGAWFSNEAVERWGDIGAEFMEFLSARIHEDVKTQQAILHCKDPAELRKIQEDFLQTAVDQYAAQAGRMTELTNAFLASMMLPPVDD
ncbi:phasin family protein [Defluviimonas sp. WL0002]|uniref:Phasin family protein n=1 Tax=Albidovulum marisflavi TaxID=2984159 RepID=A0ABT2ZGV3_9RHOB|nr:phasin family protein [Defluviimonas sp. WL0002]MCV2869956.1 phasin family protein [Defluviimonas sp. WL0002]